MIADEPLIKKTIIVFADNTVKYSYVRSGLVQFFVGCGSYDHEYTEVGKLYPIKDMIKMDGDRVKNRFILVHEDTRICCFYSDKPTFDTEIIKCEEEVTIEPNLFHVVIDGEFNIEGRQTKIYDLLGKRDKPVKLYGSGVIAKISI